MLGWIGKDGEEGVAGVGVWWGGDLTYHCSFLTIGSQYLGIVRERTVSADERGFYYEIYTWYPYTSSRLYTRKKAEYEPHQTQSKQAA